MHPLLKACKKKVCWVFKNTLELNNPKDIDSNDPRRNIFTPNGNGADDVPTEFTAELKKGEDYDKPDNYAGKYCLLFKFDFLIDQNGKIHVVPVGFDGEEKKSFTGK